MQTSKPEIAAGNLIFRSTLIQSERHKIVLSARVADLLEKDHDTFSKLLDEVRAFNCWTNAQDPHGERNIGRITVGQTEYFFKIDLYDSSWEHFFDQEKMPHSQCHRLLTLTTAAEALLTDYIKSATSILERTFGLA